MVVVQGVNDAVAIAPPGNKAKVAEDPKLVRDRGRLELHVVGETCGRLLYWDPARDAPQKKQAQKEESIAASIVRASS